MGKGCLQLDMANGDIKDLHRRIASGKVLCNIIFMIHNVDLLQWFINVTRAKKSAIESEIMHNQQLAEKLHKPIIWKFQKRKTILTVLILWIWKW